MGLVSQQLSLTISGAMFLLWLWLYIRPIPEGTVPFQCSTVPFGHLKCLKLLSLLSATCNHTLTGYAGYTPRSRYYVGFILSLGTV